MPAKNNNLAFLKEKMQNIDLHSLSAEQKNQLKAKLQTAKRSLFQAKEVDFEKEEQIQAEALLNDFPEQ